MEQPLKGRITELLNAVRLGDRRHEDELIASIYGQLRRLAAQQMSRERRGHTLQATALVHEAYMRIFGQEPAGGPSPAGHPPIEWQNRQHFLAIAAREIRRTLVEHARHAKAEKRGGDAPRVSLEDLAVPPAGLVQEGADMLDLHDLLGQLESVDAEAARVIELKFFGGLTDREVAAEMGISFAKVRRDWTFARAWLVAKLDATR
jgi:RNA polymerase sigma factor (TIGR02999 family)